ncbi:MAG: Na/Pi symporter, partial [Lachnospiraceae bacterium]|nr:Na/Pi symporter [Lachnospiraceae bacterium]
LLIMVRNQRKKDVSNGLIGFGLLFIGLSMMSGAVTTYRDSPVFAKAFSVLGAYPLLAILVGAIVTALMQSSSASVGVLQTLAMNGMVTWKSAVFITLGQNIGTCVTALISSVGAHKTAKRAAAIHLIFNVLGAVIFAIIMSVLFFVWQDFAVSHVSSVGISVFHTIFNVSCTLILFPFADFLVKLSGILVKDKKRVAEPIDDRTDKVLALTMRRLDKRILGNAAFAIEEAAVEVIHMGQVTYDNMRLSFEAVLENDEEKAKLVSETEKTIDKMAHYISDYLVKVNSADLSEEQSNMITNLFYSVGDIERMGDHAEDLAEIAMYKIRHDMRFSKAAYEELHGLMEMVTNSCQYCLQARELHSRDFANKAMEYENMVDEAERQLRKKHMKRLSLEQCKPMSGVTFLNILTNLERIADHADNVAGYVLQEMG